jgi:hypothetical protein
VTKHGGSRYLIAIGMATDVAFVGDRAVLPRLQAIGAPLLGFGLVVVGAESIRTRSLAVGGSQRGKAAGSPPSIGSTAPVVGVRSAAKKTTARPTCVAVTLARSRLRCR